MLPGSFYAFVPRSPVLTGWLSRSKTQKLVSDKLETCISSRCAVGEQPVDASHSNPLHPRSTFTQVQKYVLSGGGVTVRHGVHQLATECYRMNPYVYSDKNNVVVFYGYLSNLDDLVQRCAHKLNADLVNAVHYPLHDTCMLERNRDIGTLSANVILQSYLDSGEGSELVLLSELQGHYAFVIYDSSRRQAFAARDCSGDEKLFYQTTDNGSISFTNDPNELPDAVAGGDWVELPPGHFISGRVPKVQQFALTLKQLESLSAEMDSGIFDASSTDARSRGSSDSFVFDLDN